MSLKSTFLAFKKSCTSCPNWEEGEGEVIWSKSKRTAVFPHEIVPNATWSIIDGDDITEQESKSIGLMLDP